MAENKLHLSRVLEKGTLLIHQDVLEAIVMNAIKEIDGVAGLSSRPAMDIIEIIGKKNTGKNLKIAVEKDEALTVICNINIYYGHDIMTTARAVQYAISDALESVANVVVSKVNVNICGIIRK